MQYGYVRVSAKDQNEDRQVAALADYGIDKRNMIVDKQSGKDFERPGYLKLLRKLKKKDVLVVKSIDRFGRNYEEILEQWRLLTKEKKVDIVVLDMPLLNTEQKRDLTGALISDIVLQLLCYVAQTEREFIKQRQKEGIDAAKKKGVQFGRKPKARPFNYEAVKKEYQNGELSLRAAAQKTRRVTHYVLEVDEGMKTY